MSAPQELIIAMPMPIAPTPKDLSTVRVLQDTLEMVSFVKVF